MLTFYDAVATRYGLMLLEHDLQIPQRFTTDYRRLHQLNLAGCRIEHPFRQLQQTHPDLANSIRDFLHEVFRNYRVPMKAVRLIAFAIRSKEAI